MGACGHPGKGGDCRGQGTQGRHTGGSQGGTIQATKIISSKSRQGGWMQVVNFLNQLY